MRRRRLVGGVLEQRGPHLAQFFHHVPQQQRGALVLGTRVRERFAQFAQRVLLERQAGLQFDQTPVSSAKYRHPGLADNDRWMASFGLGYQFDKHTSIDLAYSYLWIAPGDANFQWASLLIVASTVCSAFYQLYSRRYGRVERPDASATMATIVGSVVAAPMLPLSMAFRGPLARSIALSST